ncbi:tyrosine-type recombinase/integrase [Gillisia sp. JM1]|uniref:tyrosine-type recombinase/integrase n=1 Tax=Gillisia sp. JM1 TaxID=1283286 RepID=UPI0004788A02|nr:tyrosine-type recombinase/integrase [Gillisia sp. JM1]
MNLTVSFNYTSSKHYAIDLFNEQSQAYQQDKKVEALLILIGIDTGFRVSDLLKLRFSDIQLTDKGKPEISGYVAKKKRTEVKPLSTTTNRLIETYNNYCILHNGYVNDCIFFNYNNDKVYTRQWTHKRLNKANDVGLLGKKVNVAGAHSLRRTAGHNIFSKTKDLRDVQFLLGHDRMKQTEHYLKLDQTEALDRLHRVYD